MGVEAGLLIVSGFLCCFATAVAGRDAYKRRDVKFSSLKKIYRRSQQIEEKAQKLQREISRVGSLSQLVSRMVATDVLAAARKASDEIKTIERNDRHRIRLSRTGREAIKTLTKDLDVWNRRLETAEMSARKEICQARQREPAPNTTSGRYDIFLSHAGEDKYTIALPLWHKLQAAGVETFLDIKALEPGQNSRDEMMNALNQVSIGVVIISPEFAAKKWPMAELEKLLERQRAQRQLPLTPAEAFVPDPSRGGLAGRSDPTIRTNTCPVEPVIFPIFYRMTSSDCRHMSIFDESEYGKAFFDHGFFSRVANGEASFENVHRNLKELADFAGIANRRKATNEESTEMKRERTALINEAFKSIMPHVERIRSRQADPGVRRNTTH